MSFDPNANSDSTNAFDSTSVESLLLRDPFEPSQTGLGDLSRAPQMMPRSTDLSDLTLDAQTPFTERGQSETALGSTAWVDKVLAEVPIVNTAVRTGTELLNNSSALVEQTVESSKLLAKDTAADLGGSIRGWVDTAAERWNDPNNRAHNELNQQAETLIKGVQDLSTDADNSEWMAGVKTRLGTASQGFSALVGKINGSLGYVGGASLTKEEAALAEAELRLKENLVDLRDNPDFIKTFETAFGDEFDPSEATALVNDFVTGNREPAFKVVAAEALKGEGAFGDNTIFVSDQFLAQTADHPEALDAVLLEEAGHYFDQKLNATDSQGDEGEIFSRLARGEAIANADLLRMKREDDHSTLVLGDQIINVENYYLSDAEKAEIRGSSSTPVDGSDRRLYLQSGTVETFDAAFDAQQPSSPPAPEPVPPARPPENPRQADRGQPEAIASPYTGMTADAAEAWSQSAEVIAPSGNTVAIGGAGDTLWAIAARHGVQWTDLRKPNGDAFTEEDARRLQIGDQVILPGQPVEEAVSAPPENPRQADLGQPEAGVSPYAGMTADAAEAWSQSAEESVPSKNTVTIGGAGDTLSAIAARHGVQWTDLRKPNGEAFTEAEARLLQIGDQVILPGQSTEDVDSPPPENPRQADLGQPEQSISAPPENPRQADRSQPETSTSPYTGMSADAAEAWSQVAEESASPYAGMSADAAEAWSQADTAETEENTSSTGMSADAAEAWSQVDSDDDRFNDVNGDQSDIHGFDLSTQDESDALFGYVGEDGEGAWVAGTGVIDYENSDENGWLQSFEIMTAEGRGNVVGTLGQDDFIGVDFDAQVFETDLNIGGHGLNGGFLNANGNLGGDEDGYGVMVGASAGHIQYSNGAPSADNSNDLSFDGGFSLGLGGGFNLVYSDPDGDGITNLGFDGSAGPVDLGFTSEYAGQKAESAAKAILREGYENKGVIETVKGWFSIL